MKRIIASILIGISGLAACASASAQVNYPSKPITIVLPFGPGSGTDIATRLIAQKLSENLKISVVVENKPGANGSIAAEHVAKSKPDGYTLMMGTNSTHGANPALLKDIRYDPIKDFEHINRIVVFTSIVAVNPKLPVKTMKELIEYGRNNEVTLAVGNATGTVQGEALSRAAGWKKLLRVPFRSNPPAMAEVMAGRIDMMFSDIAAAQAQIKSGNLRALAVTSKDRSAIMPELPTVMESGVADFDLSGWNGLFAPAGTPKEIVEKLNSEITTIMKTPEVKKRFAEMGAEAGPMTTKEYAAWVQEEVNKWTKLVNEAGIKFE